MKRAARYLLFVILLSPWGVVAQSGRSNAPPYRVGIRYEVSLLRRAQHFLHITMQVTPAPDLRVQLPVWNGLYQVRDFSQYVSAIRARDSRGNPVDVRAIDKTTWAVPNADIIEYDMIAELSGPFGIEVNDHHAFLNLAAALMYVVGHPSRQRQVVVFSDAPADWKLATSMHTPAIGSVPFSCLAESYDEMVDSPVEIGAFQEGDFEQDDARYRVIVDANPSDYDMHTITEMARKLAAAEVEWMNDRPFDHYLFLFHFPRRPAGGGMEHAYSTAIDASADRVKRDPLSLADITAHEFFHLWNVKRIRPQSLEPVDYTKEQYTRALWFSEGVTSTVADYMRVRAGYLDEKAFLAELATDIRHLESRPARLTQSVEESSLDAWLEKYPPYDSPQRSVSYYNKGEILGMLLDLQMREASAGKKSLRDLFHWMNANYAQQGKGFPDSRGVQDAAEAVTGADFRDFFTRYVAGADPIPYDKFLATVGLRLDKQTVVLPNPGFRTVRRPANAATVVSVDPGSEAEKAGLRTGEVIQQIQGRAPGAVPENDLMTLRIGDTVDLRVSGATATHRVKFKLAGTPAENYSLVEREGVTAAPRARRAAWIRGESE